MRPNIQQLVACRCLRHSTVPFLLPGLLLVLASATLAPASPALCQEDWQLFDSQEISPPYTGPAFTIRIPPGFARQPSAEPGEDGNWGDFLDFILPGSPDGNLAFLSFSRSMWPEGKRPPTPPTQEFWDEMGNDLAVAGARFLRSGWGNVNGRLTAELYFAREAPETDNLVELIGLFVVPMGEWYFTIGCAFGVPAAESDEFGKPGADDPAGKTACMPSMRTLEIKG
ncbi:MAG: hypothetical protein LBT40_17060 [Deltaproteobacteria bacterium]|jgi:hypothetical protein|nr:hypothetical protein [Deltaproteobacteria bacterium]